LWKRSALAPAAAVDGKTVRGALREDGSQVHLLAAVDHDSGVVLGQRAVAAKTNEIPELCRAGRAGPDREGGQRRVSRSARRSVAG
jgi:hypothetical protein